MAKSRCVHLVTPERKPITCCGVDTSFKVGAVWTSDETMCTCKNCLKLRGERQMGAPPPVNVKSKEDKYRWAYEDRIQRMQRVVDRISTLKADIQGLIGGVVKDEDIGELVTAYDYMDNAEDRVKIVVAQIHYILHREME